MKYLLTLVLLAFIQFTNAQSQDTADLTGILNIALQENRLPKEMIIATDITKGYLSNAPYIIIKADSSKNLSRIENPPANSHVWVLDYEDIFMHQIPFAVILTRILRKQNQFTLEFKTVAYPDHNPNMTCFKGRIMAEKINGRWSILKVETSVIGCEVDFFGQPKQSRKH